MICCEFSRELQYTIQNEIFSHILLPNIVLYFYIKLVLIAI